MIKKGDIIRCDNSGTYFITNEKVYCVALTDEVMYADIKVMVIEDNRFTINSNKAIGRVYSVDPRYFEVVEYADVNAREKDRVLKTAMKLCKRSIATDNLNRYIEGKQISGDTEYPPATTNMIMRWGYASDNGKKFTILEFNLSSSGIGLKRVETLHKYTINCSDIGTESYCGEVRTLGRLKRMIEVEDSPMSCVKLYDRIEQIKAEREIEESLDSMIDEDFLALLEELTSF